ncbi:MAG: class I SAM-dependent methyltransferase [Planctomycetaceae bacterium]|nr:class I SAM-dependent methyltransferase [Planctomycetaceae bacterium]
MNESEKSSVEEIRQRFDQDVERFSNLETGQSATIDAPLVLDLIANAAAAVTTNGKNLIDVGCGAGNFSLKLLQSLPNLNVRLIDLSRPMLDRAVKRVSEETAGHVTALQGDLREVELGQGSADIIVAAAVLHHLRTEEEWRDVFQKFYEALRPGGSMWIFDLVKSDIPQIQDFMEQRYGDYLVELRDASYRDQVFEYIEKEDTPQSLTFQLECLRQVGFSTIDVLHKHVCFAAFGAVK